MAHGDAFRVVSEALAARSTPLDTNGRTQCPAHDGDHKDRNLSVAQGGTGVLLTCHSRGCTAVEIAHALDLSVPQLFDNVRVPQSTQVAIYPYTAVDGTLVMQVVRYEPKTFKQRRVLPDGSYDWKVRGVPPLLYNLPAVMRAARIPRAHLLRRRREGRGQSARDRRHGDDGLRRRAQELVRRVHRGALRLRRRTAPRQRPRRRGTYAEGRRQHRVGRALDQDREPARAAAEGRRLRLDSAGRNKGGTPRPVGARIVG